MWKTVLIVVAIIIGIMIAAGVSWFMVNPDGFVDAIMSMGGQFHIAIGDHTHEIIIDEYRDGAEPGDRGWLAKKWVLLHVMARKDAAITAKRDEFGQAVIDAASDRILEGGEMKVLREMHSDVATPEMIKHWVKTLNEIGGEED